MKSCLDKSFVYRKAVETDVAKTFERIRREQEQAAKETAQKVARLKAQPTRSQR